MLQLTPALNLRSHLCKDSFSYTSTPQISQLPGWVPTGSLGGPVLAWDPAWGFYAGDSHCLYQAVQSSDFTCDYPHPPTLLVKTASLPVLFL